MSTRPKPHAPACERNRDAILQVLRTHFAARHQVLEIGSGTGQHAVYFAGELPQLTWQTSDLATQLPGIRLWVEEAALPNLRQPILLDVNGTWPADRYDAAFSANTLHIMSPQEVARFFGGLGRVLTEDGVLAVYGPFNYGGRFTSDSNAAFDGSLRAQSASMGIRDFEAIDALARAIGLQLIEDCPLPANNRTLVWRRNGTTA